MFASRLSSPHPDFRQTICAAKLTALSDTSNIFANFVHKQYGNMSGQKMDSCRFISDERYRRIHFAVMAIENGARKLGISGKEMHDRLSRQGLIRNRLIKRYEELHTQSLDWVADDICETLINREAGA